MVELLLPYINTPILKAWDRASRAQRSLKAGIVRRQFPWLRGTTWRNNWRSAWNGFRFEHIYAFLTLTGWNWKRHVIIMTKTDLSGFVVTMHSGFCEQHDIPLGLKPSGFDFLFARALVHCDNKPLQIMWCYHPYHNENRSIGHEWVITSHWCTRRAKVVYYSLVCILQSGDFISDNG